MFSYAPAFSLCVLSLSLKGIIPFLSIISLFGNYHYQSLNPQAAIISNSTEDIIARRIEEIRNLIKVVEGALNNAT